MTGPDLSNYLADLAERAGERFRRGRARTIEAATDYIEAGRILAIARDECRGTRGAWGVFLTRADIAETTARLLIRIARADMDPATLADLGLRGAAAAVARPPKPATVAVLETPSPDPKARARERREERRARRVCVDCGEPAGDHARCPKCRGLIAERDKQRRALARTGEALNLGPRLAEATKTGTGLTLKLTAAEVVALGWPET